MVDSETRRYADRSDLQDLLEMDIHDLMEMNTHPLDLVASWESLCQTYRMLEFNDAISDSMKMEEFKWIIKEMNKHLTRARKKLLTCRDIDAMIQALLEMYTSTNVNITNRQSLAYHKYRQTWIEQMKNLLMAKKEMENGKPEQWAD